VSSILKDFKTIYREQGAYHRQAEGFKAWFLEDNYRAIASRLPARGEILDLACGEGCLADGIGEQRLVGVDYSPDALRLNRELCGRYAELHLGDMARLGELPFRDGQFDAVVCSLSLMYLQGEGLRRCLGDVRRFLRPGGPFIFTYPTVSAQRKANPEAVELEPPVLRRVLEAAGFTIEELSPFVPLVPKEIVDQSMREPTRAAARAAYDAAKATLTLATSYHFVCVAGAPR